MKKLPFIRLAILLTAVNTSYADDGYRLWLRYDRIEDDVLLEKYRSSVRAFMLVGNSETMRIAEAELINGLNGIMGSPVPQTKTVTTDGMLIAGKAHKQEAERMAKSILKERDNK